jgi:hypothetical protein
MDKGIDDIDTALENHLNNIVQTDAVNDTVKYPSAAVTYAHGQTIAALNNNLVNYYKKYSSTASAAFLSSAMSAIKGNNSGNVIVKVTVIDADGLYYLGVMQYKPTVSVIETRLSGTLTVVTNAGGTVAASGGTAPYTYTAELLSSK